MKKTIILLTLIAGLLYSCNTDENDVEKKPTSDQQLYLFNEFGISNIQKQQTVDLSNINNISLISTLKTTKISERVTDVLTYSDGSKGYIISPKNEKNTHYLIYVDHNNKLIAERKFIIKILDKSTNEISVLLSDNKNNEQIYYINSKLKADFNDCFFDAAKTVTDDVIGFIAFATNPVMCSIACAISCL